MTISFRLYPAFNFVTTVLYGWFLFSALNDKAFGAALIVSYFWGWAILAIPPFFLITDYICGRKGIRFWAYISGVSWTLIWFGAATLVGIMMMGVPWLSSGRHDLAPFSTVFFVAASINMVVLLYLLFSRKYRISIGKS